MQLRQVRDGRSQIAQIIHETRRHLKTTRAQLEGSDYSRQSAYQGMGQEEQARPDSRPHLNRSLESLLISASIGMELAMALIPQGPNHDVDDRKLFALTLLYTFHGPEITSISLDERDVILCGHQEARQRRSHVGRHCLAQ